MFKIIIKSAISGFLATIVLLGIYFSVVTFVSGWPFALEQFLKFWYFILGLAIGFGIQVGLYVCLKNIIRQNAGRGVIAVSGTTSTVAMISCCAHYLANILPIIGITGAISLIGQYQIQLFWFGLLANLIGIIYIGNKIRQSLKML